MVSFTTFDDLKRFKVNSTKHRANLRARASNENYKDTFLSHSSKDSEYLPEIIELLENHGASVYCDLDDDRMPETPNPETAKIIKNQINNSKKLVVFITINSKDSKWVPWELGVGDSCLNTNNVALFPVSSTSYEQSWAKQEYLGLYDQIVWGKIKGDTSNGWLVYNHHNNTASKLREWLSK